jgi:hypothetical protein
MAQLLHLKSAFKASAVTCRRTITRSSQRHAPVLAKTQQSPVELRQQSASCSTAVTCIEQAFRVCSSQSETALTLVLLATAIGGLALLAPESAAAAADAVSSSASSYHPTEIAQVAENDEFWSNVLRYIRYFFTVTSGGLYALASPFLNLFKKPTTAVLAVCVAIGAVFVLQFTLNAMLGISEPFEYTPSSAVTNAPSPYVANF